MPAGASDVLDLVRDLLDKQVVDRDGVLMGKADGIVLECPASGPPHAVGIEIGVTTFANRLHPRLASWLGWLARRMGVDTAPTRLPLAALRRVSARLEFDVEARRTGAMRWETSGSMSRCGCARIGTCWRGSRLGGCGWACCGGRR